MDYDLAGYRELTRSNDIPILPSGSWIQDLPVLQDALDTNSWSEAWTDVTVCGGFTPARNCLSAVEPAGMQCVIMSLGNTLVSSANLHLMFGTSLSTYFEQAVPWEPYEYGMRDVIRTQPDGHAVAPSGPGLGMEIDWDAMEPTTIHHLETRSHSLPLRANSETKPEPSPKPFRAARRLVGVRSPNPSRRDPTSVAGELSEQEAQPGRRSTIGFRPLAGKNESCLPAWQSDVGHGPVPRLTGRCHGWW